MTNRYRQDATDAARSRLQDMARLRGLGMLPKDGDFFPSVHYPSITMYPPISEEAMFGGYEMPADGLVDIYVHIPFCRRRCVFCHYPSHYGAGDEEKDGYLTALEKEMDLLIARLGVRRLQARSILIGGGTPTDLSPLQLERFLKFFVARVEISPKVQFNYDVDPGTLVGPEGEHRLRLLRDYGVNRLTIGVQSLRDDLLRAMNRDHDAATARLSVANSLALGFKVNIEFIFGYPGQTLENWLDVVEGAIALNPDEIQLYRLKVIPYGDQRGAIERVRELRPQDIPPVEEALTMKQAAIEVLRAHGYLENLRRVFTRDRANISKYAFNQCCMLFDQVGLGQTAFSSYRNRFALNTQSFDEYYACIAAGRLPVNRGLVRSLDDQMRWAIILPLKNYSLRRRHFQKVTGVALEASPFAARLQLLKEHGLVDETALEFRLTPLGAFFADEVVELFHARPYIPFPATNYEPGPLNPYELNPA